MADLMKLMEKEMADPNFSWKRVMESCKTLEAKGQLKEAIPESMFGQLLRAGIQNIANQWYKIVPVIYPDLVQEVSSDKRQEWYAPLYRPNLPKQVSAGGEFEESGMKGVDREIVNYKFGRIEAFERELFDDDQTGQVKTRAGQMGENIKILEEIYVTGKLTGAAFSYGPISVPASDYTTTISTGASVSGVYSTSVGNRPATFAYLGQTTLENADIALQNMVDPLGNRMMVLPNTLVVSSADKFNAAKLLQSALQPSIPGVAGSDFTAQGGVTGYTNTINPLQGLYTLKVDRFLTSKSWYLMEAKKGLIFQRRDPLEVVQELPASGKGFSEDAYRFRTRVRFGCEWIECRFTYQGNDGTAQS